MARRFSGQRLREARLAAGLRPEQLALHIDRSVWVIHDYERGRSAPSAEVLPAIADTVKSTIDYLFAEVATDAA